MNKDLSRAKDSDRTNVISLFKHILQRNVAFVWLCFIWTCKCS